MQKVRYFKYKYRAVVKLKSAEVSSLRKHEIDRTKNSCLTNHSALCNIFLAITKNILHNAEQIALNVIKEDRNDA